MGDLSHSRIFCPYRKNVFDTIHKKLLFFFLAEEITITCNKNIIKILNN